MDIMEPAAMHGTLQQVWELLTVQLCLPGVNYLFMHLNLI